MASRTIDPVFGRKVEFRDHPINSNENAAEICNLVAKLLRKCGKWKTQEKKCSKCVQTAHGRTWVGKKGIICQVVCFESDQIPSPIHHCYSV